MAKKKKKCPVCGKKYINLGAHMRAHDNEEKNKSFITPKRIIAFIGLTSLILAAWGVYFVFNLRGGASDVTAELETPKEITRGVPFEIGVAINNQTSENVRNTELVIRLSEGLVNLDFEGGRQVINVPVGDIGSGGLTKKTVRLLPIGEVGEEETIKTSFSYSFGSANFEESLENTITIDKKPIELSVSTPDQILSGSSFLTEITYKNNTDFDFPQLRLQATYPDSFEFLSSNLSPGASNNQWNLGALNAGREGTLEIRGRLQQNEDMDNTHVEIMAGFLEEFYTIASTQKNIKPSRSPISLEIRQRGAAVSGNEIEYEILYENKSGVALKDVEVWAEMVGEMFNFDSLETDGEFSSLGNVVRWNKKQNSDLEILEPSESGSVSFRVGLKDRYPIRRLSDKNFTLQVKSRIESPTVPYYVKSDKTSTVAETETKVRGETDIEAEGYFRDAGSGILNGGSLPPEVGESTQYTIHWKITNYSTDIKNVRVEANLPEGVEWTGQTKSNGESAPNYDEEARSVVWEISEVPATKGVITRPLEAIFQLEATPAPNMVGGFQALLGATTLTANDEFTGRTIESSAAPVTTELKADPTVGNGQGEVVQ